MLERILGRYRKFTEERQKQRERNNLLGLPHDPFLEKNLPLLRKGDISVQDFLRGYSARDKRMLELFPSYDNPRHLFFHLSGMLSDTWSTDKIDDLVKHEFEHVKRGKDYGINCRVIVFSFKDCYGARTCTLNLYEIGKDCDLTKFEEFWKHFLKDVHESDLYNPFRKK